VVPIDRVVEFLHPMPVGALWGVGPKTEEQLHRLGLRTVGDLAHTPQSTLERALGVATGKHLADLAWGRDERSVEAAESERSIGNEQTFFRDIDDPDEIKRELLKLSEQVAGRVRAHGVVARTFTLKVRFADFTTITRSKTLPDATDTSHDVYATIVALFDGLHLQRARIRLVGVKADGLRPASERSEQLAFDTPEHGWRDADRAKDKAVARFGKGAVKPARLVNPQDGV
jgi:DNA polymerase-4